MLASIDSYRFHPLPAKAGILAESATGNRRAVPGALGSMQPVPATARRFGIVHPADPVQIHCERGALLALAVGSPRRRRDATRALAGYTAREGVAIGTAGCRPTGKRGMTSERCGTPIDGCSSG